ncbi:MAG: formylglycine-generating enzyme family protein, partial [Planctomycetaceae bacterium]|nr:formylglycine-generating enzyme family protein [Planctomycetaceae bacterium]
CTQRRVGVRLTQPFYLGQTPVTQAEWFQVMQTKPWTECRFPRIEDVDRHPVSFVNWSDAMAACHALHDVRGDFPNGWNFTLPTDAQWEYACRSGTTTRFSFGNEESQLSEYCWFTKYVDVDDDHPVGEKRPNPWGLHDMHGNIREWCRDGCPEKSYGGVDPEIVKDECRVVRGASWEWHAPDMHSAFRMEYHVSTQFHFIGFRAVAVPSQS